MGTDGPFTVAVNITGGEILRLICYDKSFVEKFLWFINDAPIERMRAWHRLLGKSFPYEGFMFADDSIQLLSPKLYRSLVLPLHKEIVKTFCVGRPGIHLCGAVEQHLEDLKEELHIRFLDTGFPLSLERAREILGEDVTIRGNLNILTLLEGLKDKIREETLKIIGSGATRGRRFIFGEGNNVAPKTPPENLNYAYEIVRKYGEYDC
ncbi:MAG: uroporphyrinogen decarboxylase family protein [Candidatus Bathyarchaeota archaeon]|nr:uroporphyrinogen decarboxylase family protein [Candidatus Bathyarchaeota archaeon]